MEKQEQVIEIAQQLWEKFLEIPDKEKSRYDPSDVRHHLDAIKNIMYSQLFVKKEEIRKDLGRC